MKQREVCAEEICHSICQYLQIQAQVQVLSEDNPLPPFPPLSSISSAVPFVGNGDRDGEAKSRIPAHREAEVEKDSERDNLKERQRQKQTISDALECGVPAAGRLVSLLQQAFAFQIQMQSMPPANSPTHVAAPEASSAFPHREGVTQSPTSASASTSAAAPSSLAGEAGVLKNIPNPPHNHPLSARPVVRIHRLLEDYNPLSVPSSISAMLTKYTIVSSPALGVPHSESAETSREGGRRNVGDIKCFSMITAPGGESIEGSGLSAECGYGYSSDKLTVVAGTDRGSLLLWQTPAKQKRTAGTVDSYNIRDGDGDADKDRDGDCVFDIADEGFADRLIAPSAVLQLRKGDNVRVRRTYRDDDDDYAELFPPKIRDVAISSATDSLVWSHSDSSSSSSALVAAALSDGTIALVCVHTGRVGDKDDCRSRAKSKSRGQGVSYLTDGHAEERRDAKRELSFSNKRSYLETHEVHSGTQTNAACDEFRHVCLSTCLSICLVVILMQGNVESQFGSRCDAMKLD